jgi:uncharacterized protein YdaU (DUF1376 family)
MGRGVAMNMFSPSMRSTAALCAAAWVGVGSCWAAREVPKEKPRCHRLAGLGGVDQRRKRILHGQQSVCNEYVLVAAMNYYERHLGDYARDTSHLSMLEHGAFTLLLDRYYSSEAPIPAAQAHRLARARTKEEQKAVDVVLEEFFKLSGDVWVNTRVEAEIAKKETKTKAAQANGVRGGRPKNVAVGSEKITQEKPTGFPLGSENITQEKPTGFPLGSENITHEKAHQTPVTSNQTPDPLTPQPGGTVVGVDGPEIRGQQTPSPQALATIAMRKAGMADANPSHPELIALVKAGVPADIFAAAAEEAVRRGKPFAYAIGVVKRQVADAAEIERGGPVAMGGAPKIDPRLGGAI